MRHLLLLIFYFTSTIQLSNAQDNKFSLSGNTTDCKTHKNIKGVELKLFCSDGRTLETFSDSLGSYYFDSFLIKKNMKYVVTTEVTRDLGYINSSSRYKFGTFDSVSNKNIKQDFCLVRIEPCTLGTFRIYFKKNSEEKYYVDTLSMDLESYIMFINDNPSFVIEINSNCSFDEKNPDSLSKKRAEYLKNILIKKGINKDRVVIKALGIKHPSVTVTPPKNRTV